MFYTGYFWGNAPGMVVHLANAVILDICETL